AQETGQNLLVQGTGPMFNTSFTELAAIKNYRDTLQTDKIKLKQFIAGLHDRGIRVIGRGLWYISAVHTEEDIDKAIEVGSAVLKEIA
ncbi:MAG TPA: aspartate aminotransferase family protein, partial [Sphingobacterium sp.]|nr:aspartate aminotransferase family protein [Sphingobacterium sp.]